MSTFSMCCLCVCYFRKCVWKLCCGRSGGICLSMETVYFTIVSMPLVSVSALQESVARMRSEFAIVPISM